MLDALPHRAAVLDPDGRIVRVNGAWRQAARMHSGHDLGVGVDYLAVCRRAASRGDDIAQTVLDGLTEVLGGRRRTFDVDYPCHGPEGRAWFQMRATALPDGRGALVVHESTTTLHVSQEALERSRVRLQAMFDGDLDAILFVDDAGRCLDANPAAVALLGESVTERPGHCLEPSVRPEHQATFLARWQAGLAADSLILDVPLTASDGRRVEAELRATLHVLPDRHLLRVRDVTERRQSDRARRESARLFIQLANAMPPLVWTTDDAGHVDFCNDRWYAYTGMERLPRGRPFDWGGVLHPDDVEPTRERWEHSLDTGTPFDVHVRLRGAEDEQYRWFIGRAMPARDASGRLTRWFGTFTDIHELVDAERALNEAVQRTEEILESITDAFFALDTAWRFTYLNAQASRLLRRAPEDLIGKCVWDEFPGALESAFGEHYHRAVESGEAMTFDARYEPLGADYEVRAFPFAGGLSVYFRDVTEQRRADAVLRASEERLRLISAATDDVIWDLDLGTGIITMGPSFVSATGWTVPPDELTLDWMTERTHPDDRERVSASLQAAIGAAADSWQEEYRFLCADGSYADVLNRGSVVRDARGAPVRVVGAVLDLSDRKAAERALVEAKEQAEAMMRLKSSFLSNMSHEIRTPLTAILGFAEVLSEEVEGEHRDLARSIHRGGQRLLTTLNNVLDLAQLEGESVQLRPVPLVVEDETRGVLDLLGAVAAAKGLTLALDGDAATTAIADRGACTGC